MLASYLMIALSTTLGADATAPADPCGATAGHRSYTILLEPSGRFVHCRDGETTETSPISGEDVVLQLPPVNPRDPFRFRLLHSKKPHGAHTRLFGSQLETALEIESALNELTNSSQTIGEAPAPESASPGAKPGVDEGRSKKISQSSIPAAVAGSDNASLREALVRRLQYLGVATPGFSDALHDLRGELPVLAREVEKVDAACAAQLDTLTPSPLRDAVAQGCGSAGPGEALRTAIHEYQGRVTAFVKARRAARDALVELAVRSNLADEQQAAAKAASDALQKATANINQLIDDAPALASAVSQFIRDANIIRSALSISPAAVDGLRLHLGRFSAAGLFDRPVVYQLHVAREPSPLHEASSDQPGEAGAPAQADEETEVLIDRFQPAERRFFSLELAVVYSQGLPDHPALDGRLNHQMLVQAATHGFEGGVLASLEPLEFAYAEYPWAGLLRFPTIIIPFTINPLTNYFVGGGIGWNNIGSLTAGAHIALTTLPAPGTPYGTVFTTSPINLDHVTKAGPVAAGWFVGASVDVLGIVHLFFEDRQPVVQDAASGANLGAK